MSILIADSGSTKTDWRYAGADGRIRQFATEGLNPYFTDDEVLRLVMSEVFPEDESPVVNEVYFYGAGCAAEAQRARVAAALAETFPAANIEVHHDLLAAARALCGRDAGMAAILGTGSNSCLYDGTAITENRPSLGFVLGDEGSGAYIGKQLLRDFLYGNMPDDLSQRFRDRFQLDRDAVVQKIYREPAPNRFAASFSKFVYQNIAQQYCVDLVANSFRAFFEAHILRYSGSRNVPLHVTGSVGFYFSNILRRVSEEQGVMLGKVVESPIAGLALYHFGE